MKHNKTDLIREAITEYWGPRCKSHDPDCPCCEAWEQVDRLERFFDAVAGLTKNPAWRQINQSVAVKVVYPKTLALLLGAVDKEWDNGN